MKCQKICPIFALLLGLVTVVSAQDAVKPAPTADAAQARTPAQAEFLKWKFGLFLHFNLATFNGQEWANGYEDPLTFAPTNLDCGQWADAAQVAGMKYAVLTVKHTEGFPLWDSAVTTHDITAFKHFKDGKGDIVREFVDAFRARDLKVGFYYCAPGDFDNRYGNARPTNQPSLHGMPPEAQGDYAGCMRQQFTELLTRYGPVDLIWCDQYRVKLNAKEWADLKALIHQLQPNCLVIANNSHQLSETDIYSYEYPLYKSEKGYPPVTNAIPSEVCDTIVDCGNWFWQPGVDAHLRSAADIVGVLKKCNDRQANYLLDVGPDRTGRIDAAAVKRLQEIGDLRRVQGEK